MMRTTSLSSMARLAAGWLAALALATVAVGQEAEEEVEDQPERIARLGFTQGPVTLRASGEAEWGEAVVNRPLVVGDQLRTEAGGRAEVQVGGAIVRLAGDTEFTFVELSENALRMRVASGVVSVSVRGLDDNEVVEIITPQISASALRTGSYRLEVNTQANTTVLEVSNGVAEAVGLGQSSLVRVVRAQQQITFTGAAGYLSAGALATPGAPDEFDSWGLERDQRLATAESGRYVTDDIVGYEDLDGYGQWSTVPEYGTVWTPNRVISGWSPYRYGRYSYVPRWGWTWLDDAPWGFAPFHYGSWITIGGRWSWVPGPRHGFRRPIGHPPHFGHSPKVTDRPGKWRIPREPGRVNAQRADPGAVRSSPGFTDPRSPPHSPGFTTPSATAPFDNTQSFRSKPSYSTHRGYGDRRHMGQPGGTRFESRPDRVRPPQGVGQGAGQGVGQGVGQGARHGQRASPGATRPTPPAARPPAAAPSQPAFRSSNNSNGPPSAGTRRRGAYQQ